MLERLIGFQNSPRASRLEPLVRQVVESSLPGVLQRVADHTDGMSLSEARGYVRARAAQVVKRQTRLAIMGQPEAQDSWKASIVRQATERLVPHVLRQAAVGVPAALPRVSTLAAA